MVPGRSTLLALPLLTTAALAGCATPGDDTGTSTAVSAIAMLASAAPPPADGTAGPVDPQTLLVFVGNTTASCDAPYLPPWHEGVTCAGADRSAWQVVIGVPSDRQAQGMLSLTDPAVFQQLGSAWVEGDKCAGGTTSTIGGEVEIVALDPASITVRFQDLPDANNAGPADDHLSLEGQTVVAARCP